MGNLYPGQDPPAPAPSETLVGDPIVDKDGDELGKLEHIVLDVPRGRIAYAVLGRGGVFGIGERLFAVPWSALALDAQRKCFVLDISRERLDRAPGFDRDHWPAMGDPRWAREVHDFYAARPYWWEADLIQ